MTYPFVQAHDDYGPRKGPVRAFVIHMAEGGGTVGFLSRDNARGVSVHYVIEGTGRIVQMLSEGHASGSINPREIRTSDDADGFFGASAAKAVMGSWWSDPNAACISVEIEGFAKSGPNSAQHGSLKTLVSDVRSRHAGIGLLGHRDFADYKACPGKLVHWTELGGHGPAQEEQMGLHITYPGGPIVTGALAISKGVVAVRIADGTHYAVPSSVTRPATRVALAGGLSGPGYQVDLNGDEAHFVRVGAAAVFTPNAIASTGTTDCGDKVAAEHERVRAAAIVAAEAL